jgi:hypothetical protein
LVTLSRYEPLKPEGSVATIVTFVNVTRVSLVVARVTVGATPAGLKLCPVMVIWVALEFTTVW